MKIEKGIAKDVDFNSKEGKEVFWHSSAHLLAAAIKHLFPKVKITIGPPIENGFYYDFDNLDIKQEDFARVEKEMYTLVNKNTPFEYKEVTKKEALQIFKDEPYKIELINDLPNNEKITTYKLGDFIDLCRGPHLEKISMIQSVKLLSIAGAYWRGSEKNKMLTRIYAISFPNKDELKTYLNLLEEAKKRDHRKLGTKLELFLFSDLVGAGLPLYTPAGNIIRNEIIKFSRELQTEIGYEEVHTPQFNRAELFKVSGHYDKYKENMFTVKSNYTNEEFFLKPMNCPQHTQIYASKQRSYRDLPVRLADFAMLYRDEKPGELSGFSRLRAFSQDDAHNFCRPDQIKDEVRNVLKVIKIALQTYGLNYWIRLSYRDPLNKEKYLGSDEIWEKGQKIIKQLALEEKLEFVEAIGEAAFYGPKIDIIVKDALQREWQVSTVQLDFNMPGRFGLKYIDQDNTEKTPVMIHRALIGSPDRFFGILLEHYGGKFPMWLSPRQVLIVPVADAFNNYALEIEKQLKQEGLRVDCDTKPSSMNKKIREGEIMYYNYILIVGEKEQQAKTANIRIRDTKEQKEMSIKEFVTKAKQEYEKRAIKTLF
ncbi:MAG: threonine--tRNA ligase [Candidatus Diapherotrites archaeon CG08_land_8_20_14_0_20_30_16]|nr:MAG: threonine--tRNA ligase [Candidatus Diapherotrites archaeon CG08_land_8_20_14_0_20_30_16]